MDIRKLRCFPEVLYVAMNSNPIRRNWKHLKTIMKFAWGLTGLWPVQSWPWHWWHGFWRIGGWGDGRGYCFPVWQGLEPAGHHHHCVWLYIIHIYILRYIIISYQLRSYIHHCMYVYDCICLYIYCAVANQFMGRTLVSNQAAPGITIRPASQCWHRCEWGISTGGFHHGKPGEPMRFLSRVFDFEGRNAQEAFLFRYFRVTKGTSNIRLCQSWLLVFAESEPNHPFFSCRFKFQHPNRLRVVGLARQRLHWRGFPPMERWPRNGCSACFFSLSKESRKTSKLMFYA